MIMLITNNNILDGVVNVFQYRVSGGGKNR